MTTAAVPIPAGGGWQTIGLSIAPADLTSERLKELLSPVLDFDKRNFMNTGIDSLPEKMREAVVAEEVRVVMDKWTVLLALGRPDKKIYEYGDGMQR